MTSPQFGGRATRVIRYARDRHDFAAPLRAALGVDDLSTLSADATGESGWSIYKVMEQSASYRTWWDLTGSAAFGRLYARFLREVVGPLFDGPILAQSCPTPRIVYADGQGEARFHRDRDYGHHEREMNFQVALTPSVASNAMWIESAEDVGDFRPAELTPGEMLMFNGANLAHGAVPNETGRSRVSFDFRVIAASDATPSHREPCGNGAPMRGAHVFRTFE